MSEERFLKICPTCESCGEKITSDWFFRIDGLNYCRDCVEEVSLETYIENHKEDTEEW